MDRRVFSLYVVIAVLIIGFCRLIGGSSVTVPNAFVNGTVANADEVNANFDALSVGTNDNFARIQDLESEVQGLETQVLDLESQVLDLDTRLSNIEAIVDPDLVDRVTALENASQSQQAVETLFYVQRSEARFGVIINCPLNTSVSGPGVFILNENQPLSGVTLDVDGSLLFDVPRDGAVLFEVIVEESSGENISVSVGSELICRSYNGSEQVVGERSSAQWWHNVISLTAGTHRLTVTGGAFCTSACNIPCASSRITLNAFTASLIDG